MSGSSEVLDMHVFALWGIRFRESVSSLADPIPAEFSAAILIRANDFFFPSVIALVFQREESLKRHCHIPCTTSHGHCSGALF